MPFSLPLVADETNRTMSTSVYMQLPVNSTASSAWFIFCDLPQPHQTIRAGCSAGGAMPVSTYAYKFHLTKPAEPGIPSTRYRRFVRLLSHYGYEPTFKRAISRLSIRRQANRGLENRHGTQY